MLHLPRHHRRARLQRAGDDLDGSHHGFQSAIQLAAARQIVREGVDDRADVLDQAAQGSRFVPEVRGIHQRKRDRRLLQPPDQRLGRLRKSPVVDDVVEHRGDQVDRGELARADTGVAQPVACIAEEARARLPAVGRHADRMREGHRVAFDFDHRLQRRQHAQARQFVRRRERRASQRSRGVGRLHRRIDRALPGRTPRFSGRLGRLRRLLRLALERALALRLHALGAQPRLDFGDRRRDHRGQARAKRAPHHGFGSSTLAQVPEGRQRRRGQRAGAQRIQVVVLPQTGRHRPDATGVGGVHGLRQLPGFAGDLGREDLRTQLVLLHQRQRPLLGVGAARVLEALVGPLVQRVDHAGQARARLDPQHRRDRVHRLPIALVRFVHAGLLEIRRHLGDRVPELVLERRAQALEGLPEQLEAVRRRCLRHRQSCDSTVFTPAMLRESPATGCDQVARGTVKSIDIRPASGAGADLETPGLGRGIQRFADHPLDPGHRRTPPRPVEQALDVGVGPADAGLDRAVCPVARPARKAQRAGLALHRGPEGHALHPSVDTQQERSLSGRGRHGGCSPPGGPPGGRDDSACVSACVSARESASGTEHSPGSSSAASA